MWPLVIPLLLVMSLSEAQPVLAAAPEVAEKVAWWGIALASRDVKDRGKTRQEPPVQEHGGEVGRRPDDASSQDSERSPLNVNSCSYEELLKLPGIGPKKARAIMEERERRPFRSVHDLKRVKGIGRKTIQRLAPYLTTGRD